MCKILLECLFNLRLLLEGYPDAFHHASTPSASADLGPCRLGPARKYMFLGNMSIQQKERRKFTDGTTQEFGEMIVKLDPDTGDIVCIMCVPAAKQNPGKVGSCYKKLKLLTKYFEEEDYMTLVSRNQSIGPFGVKVAPSNIRISLLRQPLTLELFLFVTEKSKSDIFFAAKPTTMNTFGRNTWSDTWQFNLI